MPRFFVSREQIRDGLVQIQGEDASHISYALRMAKGEKIVVCDGESIEYECILTDFTRDGVTAEIVEEHASVAEPPFFVQLFQALPKGDKLETVIQKAVECGVSEIVPYESDLCVVKVKNDAEERKTVRRNRIAQEAAKQCGRGKIPVVSKTLSFDDALKRAAAADISLICYEDEIGTTLKQALADKPFRAGCTISIVIGSEGGFSHGEVEKAKSFGLTSVSLGKRILRTETAPIFVLSCLSYEFEL